MRKGGADSTCDEIVLLQPDIFSFTHKSTLRDKMRSLYSGGKSKPVSKLVQGEEVLYTFEGKSLAG